MEEVEISDTEGPFSKILKITVCHGTMTAEEIDYLHVRMQGALCLMHHGIQVGIHVLGREKQKTGTNA